jgi:L-amino acid N-acyltransferase YncA
MSQLTELETNTAIRVRRAKITDIPGILAVLDHHLLAKKDSLNTTELAQTGFLVQSFTAEEARAAIADKANFQFFVATRHDETIGYITGCDVKKLKPYYRDKLAAISPELRHIVLAEKAFFLRHIAKLPGKNHVGAQLLRAMEMEASVGGFAYILCQIVEQPVQNKVSIIFHEKHGFSCAGYDQFGDEYAGIYLKHIK